MIRPENVEADAFISLLMFTPDMTRLVRPPANAVRTGRAGGNEPYNNMKHLMGLWQFHVIVNGLVQIMQQF
ncbi:MAG: hypothetical protein ACE5GU_10935 [Candidatus Scalinduaceae bacterium]